MRALASAIGERFDTYAAQLAARFLDSAARLYASQADARAGATRWLSGVIASLERGDTATFQALARERAVTLTGDGVSALSVLAELHELEGLLRPLAVDAEATRFVWAMIGDAREPVLRLVSEGAHAGLAIAHDVSARAEAERERTRQYERRAEQVRAVAEISQELSAVRGLDELLRQVVTLIKERFGYYHVQIFRYEPALDAVVLVCGYGSVGRRMLDQGHSLPMRRGVVGTAAATRTSVLAPDSAQAPGWLPNPHLPATRGELAVPILMHDRVLGIIDVQSDVVGALDDDDRLLLEAIGGPIALAIQATELREEMEASIRELRSLQRAASAEGWLRFQEAGGVPEGYAFDRLAVRPVAGATSTVAGPQRALAEPTAEASRNRDRERVGVEIADIEMNEERIGVLGVYEEPSHPLSADDVQLVRMAAEQVAAALENARLAQTTREALTEARVLYRFGELVSGELDVRPILDSVSRALVDELGYVGAYLAVIASDGDEVEEASAVGIAPASRTITRLALAARQPLVLNDVGQDERLADERASWAGLERAAAVPVRAADRAIGVLAVGRSRDQPAIGERDVRVLEAIAIQVGNAIQRARLLERTQEALAAADAATRRYLRDAWDAFLSERPSQAREYTVGSGSAAVRDRAWTSDMREALLRTEPVTVEEAWGASLAMPLSVRGEVIGVVRLEREGPGEVWTPRERETIQSLLEQIGESIESERQFAQTQMTLAETERMYQASQQIGAASDESEVAQALVDTARSMAADQVLVFLFDRPVAEGAPEVQRLVAFWDRDGVPAPVPMGRRLETGAYPLVGMLSSGETMTVADVTVDQRLASEVRALLQASHAAAFVATPLTAGGEWFGYSVVLLRTARSLTAGEMRIYESVHDQAATALRSAWLYRQAQDRARREQLIREITSRMRATPDLDTILNTAVEELGKALGVSRAFVRLGTKPAAPSAEAGEEQ
ncbi:MAG: GAF domain-containing protein [Anaerolineae bacterium]|nr:GAF domain-containing protein [Anaerolineae bacterium]